MVADSWLGEGARVTRCDNPTGHQLLPEALSQQPSTASIAADCCQAVSCALRPLLSTTWGVPLLLPIPVTLRAAGIAHSNGNMPAIHVVCARPLLWWCCIPRLQRDSTHSPPESSPSNRRARLARAILITVWRLCWAGL